MDRLEEVERNVKEQLKESMANGEHEYHELVCDFFQMHRQELDDETLENMLGVERAEELTNLEMLERLYIKRLGSSIDEEWNQQVFILDFSFNPEYTDELLVVFLSRSATVLSITHES